MKAPSRAQWIVVAGLLIVSDISGTEAACDAGSLKGDFWFIANGTVQRSLSGGNVRTDPFAELGRVSYDGKGVASLIETVVLHAGQSEVRAKGVYVVSPDCRGSVEWTLSDGSNLQTYAIVVLQGGNEISLG